MMVSPLCLASSSASTLVVLPASRNRVWPLAVRLAARRAMARLLHAGMHAFGDGRLAVHRHRAAMHTQFSQRFQLEQVAPDGFRETPNSPTMRSVETCCNVDSSARIR